MKTNLKIQYQKKLVIEGFEAKVPESFKIEPKLKLAVEEIVKKSTAGGTKVTKGQIYNLLIGFALENISHEG